MNTGVLSPADSFISTSSIWASTCLPCIFSVKSWSYTFLKAGDRLFSFFILSLLGSNLYSYFRHQDNFDYRALGASGAVSAVVFSFIVFAPWQTILVFFIPVPAIIFGALYLFYSAYMSRKGYDNIGHDAHFWGGIFGIAYTILVQPTLGLMFFEKLLHPGF
jgi:membrane associated rhomboid family serine protease